MPLDHLLHDAAGGGRVGDITLHVCLLGTCAPQFADEHDLVLEQSHLDSSLVVRWSMPQSVAFFRNLNLGQGRNPTRLQLLDAFATAGASVALSFQVNGTVLFTSRRPERAARDVVDLLTPECGYADSVVVRSAQWTTDLSRRLIGRGFAEVNAEVSLFDGSTRFPEPLPWTPGPGRVSVIEADDQHAVSVNQRPRTSYATPALERLLAVPVTSRGVGTMIRLARKIQSEAGKAP